MERRKDGRKFDELRPVSIAPGYVEFAEGSVLISVGRTSVLCNATIEEGLPRWMQQEGMAGGWITAEYAMLPRSTHRRTPRETSGLGGRTQEIRRVIGRSLRASIDLTRLESLTCTVDCDVIQADGGTRTAAITGGYVALAIALRKLVRQGRLSEVIFLSPVAAVSVGMVGGMPLLDLNYEEDRQAQVDINVVMNAAGEFVEVQGTAENAPFNRGELDELLVLAQKGIGELFRVQQSVLNAL